MNYRKMLVRVQLVRECSDRALIKSPEDAVNLVRQEMEFSDRERFVVIFCDATLRVTAIEECSVGTTTSAQISPLNVFKTCFLSNATNILILHNHPSGSYDKPSNDDIKTVRMLIEAGKILGVQIIDSIIVGDGGYLSFKQQGILF